MKDSYFSPPQQPDPLTPLYRTNDIGFAASAIASGLCTYIRTERDPSKPNVLFVLQDDFEQGTEYERRYKGGAFVRVQPRVLLEARSFLMREMNTAFAASGGRNAKR